MLRNSSMTTDQGEQNFQEEQHGQGDNMLKKSSMTRGSSMLA
jgi:hypothetical protein